jgi:iron donor protein CyaY
MLSETLYHELTDELLSELSEAIEDADAAGNLDVDFSSGVLNLTLADGSQFVINKHLPTRQIWLSSPHSGANYFSYDEDDEDWISVDGDSFLDLIRDEIRELTNLEIDM